MRHAGPPPKRPRACARIEGQATCYCGPKPSWVRPTVRPARSGTSMERVGLGRRGPWRMAPPSGRRSRRRTGAQAGGPPSGNDTLWRRVHALHLQVSGRARRRDRCPYDGWLHRGVERQDSRASEHAESTSPCESGTNQATARERESSCGGPRKPPSPMRRAGSRWLVFAGVSQIPGAPRWEAETAPRSWLHQVAETL